MSIIESVEQVMVDCENLKTSIKQVMDNLAELDQVSAFASTQVRLSLKSADRCITQAYNTLVLIDTIARNTKAVEYVKKIAKKGGME